MRILGLLTVLAVLGAAGCGSNPTVPTSPTMGASLPLPDRASPTPTATLTPTAVEESGTAIASLDQWVPIAADGLEYADLSPRGRAVGGATMAVDASGNALVVWPTIAGAKSAIYARAISASGILGPVRRLSTPGRRVEEPGVALDSAGNALAVWVCRCKGRAREVQARSIAADGTLGPLETLSSAPHPAIGSPTVAMDPQGSAVVVWEGPGALRVRIRAPDGTLTAEQRLAESWSGAPQVAVDRFGNAIVVWRGAGIQSRVVAASGSLGETHTLSEDSQAAFVLNPQLAVDANGNGVVVWEENHPASPGGQNIQARIVSASGELSAVQTLSDFSRPTAPYDEAPRVVIGEQGQAVAVWHHEDSSSPSGRIQSRAITASGPMPPLLTLSAPGDDVGLPVIALDRSGHVAFAWSIYRPTERLQVRVRSPSGALGSVVTIPSTTAGGLSFDANGNLMALSSGERIRLIRLLKVMMLSKPGENVLAPEVAVDPSGGALFAWQQFDGANWRVHAQALAADGTSSGARPLSGAGHDAIEPKVAIDSAGGGLVVWREFDGTTWRIESQRVDAAGPSGPIEAASDSVRNASEPRVALSSKGHAVVAWVQIGDTGPEIAARMQDTDGRLGPILTVSSSNTLDDELVDLHVAVDDQGDATVVWHKAWEHEGSIQARSISASGRIGELMTLSPPGEKPSAPQVTVDTRGTVFVTWGGGVEDGPTDPIEARTMSALGGLGPLRLISSFGSEARVGLDAVGNFIVRWIRPDDARVEIRTVAPSGALGSVRTLPAIDEGTLAPTIAAASNGVVLAWQGFDGANWRVYTRTLAHGTAGATQTVSAAGHDALDPRLAVDGHGNAILMWRWFDGRSYRIQTARLTLD